MHVNRYTVLRNEIFHDYSIINYHYFRVRVAKIFQMELEDVEDHRYVTFGGDIDKDELTRPREISLKITSLAPIVRNLTEPSDMGLCNADKESFVIYETIQRYLKNWKEIITAMPDINKPTLEEFLAIEDVARWVFPVYKFFKGNEINTKKKTVNPNEFHFFGIGFEDIFNYNQTEEESELSFYSHVDDLISPEQRLAYDHLSIKQHNSLSL